MESGELTIAAYVARKVSLGDRLLARKFQRVEVEVKTAEVESIGGDAPFPKCKKEACYSCSPTRNTSGRLSIAYAPVVLLQCLC